MTREGLYASSSVMTALGPAPGNDAPARGDHWRSAGPFVNASLDPSGRPTTPGPSADGNEPA